jgi:heptosyltransferase-3
VKSKKILIYRLGSLGDTIMALPCFHLIKERYPQADITLLTNKPVANKAAPLEAVLGEKSYFFNRIIDYPVGTRNPLLLLLILLKIRALGIDTMVNLAAARTGESSRRDRRFFRLAGIKNMIGFPSAEDFITDINPLTGLYDWEANRLTKRLEELGRIDLGDQRYWDLKLDENETGAARAALVSFPEDSRFIAISAGTKMQSKDWGIKNWQGLIKKLSLSLKDEWKLIMIGAAEEYALSETCLQGWEGESLNLCGKISPRVSAAVIARAALFIGHDSGPMHIAGCVGTPCIAVFAAISLPRQWFPRGERNHIIYHQTGCAGCMLQVCIEEQKKCILSITIDEVESAVLQRLNILSGYAPG